MKGIINKLKNYFSLSDTFLGYFRYLELWLSCTGSNIFNRKCFRREKFKTKLLCILILCYYTTSAIFSVISFIYPHLDDLETRLNSAISFVFGSHVMIPWIMNLIHIRIFSLLQIVMKSFIFMYKHEGYRRIKASAEQHIQEALNGSNLVYRPILFKYERYAK